MKIDESGLLFFLSTAYSTTWQGYEAKEIRLHVQPCNFPHCGHLMDLYRKRRPGYPPNQSAFVHEKTVLCTERS